MIIIVIATAIGYLVDQFTGAAIGAIIGAVASWVITMFFDGAK
jgi:uncharacterized membrane protein YvlD (DUF360 family)